MIHGSGTNALIFGDARTIPEDFTDMQKQAFRLFLKKVHRDCTSRQDIQDITSKCECLLSQKEQRNMCQRTEQHHGGWSCVPPHFSQHFQRDTGAFAEGALLS